MPTYSYLCQNCNHTFDNFQPITSGPLRKCPACEKMALKRLIGSGTGIIFKGSGFYQTDYRSSSYKADQKKDTATPPTTKESKSKDAGKKTKKTSKSDQ